MLGDLVFLLGKIGNVRVVAPIQQQQPTIHQFLADNHLAPEYATTLAEIGITEMSHCVDVTLEDLANFMKPMEARRFVRIAAQWTAAANNDNGIVAL